RRPAMYAIAARTCGFIKMEIFRLYLASDAGVVAATAIPLLTTGTFTDCAYSTIVRQSFSRVDDFLPCSQASAMTYPRKSEFLSLSCTNMPYFALTCSLI